MLAPAKPKNAFALFCNDKKQSKRSEQSGLSIHVQWTRLSPQIKASYEKKARDLKHQYQRELELYRGSRVLVMRPLRPKPNTGHEKAAGDAQKILDTNSIKSPVSSTSKSPSQSPQYIPRDSIKRPMTPQTCPISPISSLYSYSSISSFVGDRETDRDAMVGSLIPAGSTNDFLQDFIESAPFWFHFLFIHAWSSLINISSVITDKQLVKCKFIRILS